MLFSESMDDALGPRNWQDRARFEAVRARVFSEMNRVGGRWRLVGILPFHLLVLGVLAARGEPPVRLAIQAAALAMCVVTMGLVTRSKHSGPCFVLGGVCLLVTIGNTGGLASPLLVSTVPFLMGVALNPALERKRAMILGKFLVGFVVMALLAHTAVGALVGPLAPSVGFASAEYVILALASVSMTLTAIYHMSKAISGAYQRIALELAARREELCDENEGRTRALEGIAARLAHEVKNPLAAIKGLSTLVARNSTDAKTAERLGIVAREAERLQEIVDGFLSFSRGLDELHVAPTKPYEVARELELLLETRAADAGVTLEVKGSSDLVINADEKKVRQALLNLVLNAMHASSKGATVSIEVSKSCGDGAAVMRVMDRGTGMTPEILDRIQKPYFTTKEGGSGLGIAIARGIIEQHGGTLRFESSSGRGTTAVVKFPSCAAGAAKAWALPNPCAAKCAAEAKKLLSPGAQADEVGEPSLEPGLEPVTATHATRVG